MIQGDEGKPMSIMERISDAPCEPEPFIDYLLDHWRGYLEATWGGHARDEEPCVIGSVTINIDHFIMQLEDLKRKMHRPSRQDLEAL